MKFTNTHIFRAIRNESPQRSYRKLRTHEIHLIPDPFRKWPNGHGGVNVQSGNTFWRNRRFFTPHAKLPLESVNFLFMYIRKLNSRLRLLKNRRSGLGTRQAKPAKYLYYVHIKRKFTLPNGNLAWGVPNRRFRQKVLPLCTFTPL